MQRFLDAQEQTYGTALSEIKAGKKRGHWMWYIFPQIAGLGHSDTSKYFAIQNLDEAALFLQDPILGKRLIDISNALLTLSNKNARAIFGTPDDLKLHSSMTLFSLIPNADPVFEKVLDQYFNGAKDLRTVSLAQNK